MPTNIKFESVFDLEFSKPWRMCCEYVACKYYDRRSIDEDDEEFSCLHDNPDLDVKYDREQRTIYINCKTYEKGYKVIRNA